MAHPRFLPVYGKSSRNGYSLDDEVYYNREKTTLRALHDQGLLTASESMIAKPHSPRTQPVFEQQFVVSTKTHPVQHWVVTEEAYKVVHPFTYTEQGVVELDTNEYPLAGEVADYPVLGELEYVDETAAWGITDDEVFDVAEDA